MQDARRRLLEAIAREVLAVASGRVARVGVDGVDGAGKTVFADELADALRPAGRLVVRASADDFLHPRRVRYRRGRDSPDGFYLDSYDYGALRRELLDPLSPGGSRAFRRRAFDVAADAPVDAPRESAPADAVLVVDGLFLHRPGLRACWDYSVFLDVPFELSVPRGAVRFPGASPDPAAAANRRYVEGQRRYLAACEPARRATRVVDNRDLRRPVLR